MRSYCGQPRFWWDRQAAAHFSAQNAPPGLLWQQVGPLVVAVTAPFLPFPPLFFPRTTPAFFASIVEYGLGTRTKLDYSGKKKGRSTDWWRIFLDVFVFFFFF
jgi:hypothetical protein